MKHQNCLVIIAAIILAIENHKISGRKINLNNVSDKIDKVARVAGAASDVADSDAVKTGVRIYKNFFTTEAPETTTVRNVDLEEKMLEKLRWRLYGSKNCARTFEFKIVCILFITFLSVWFLF